MSEAAPLAVSDAGLAPGPREVPLTSVFSTLIEPSPLLEGVLVLDGGLPLDLPAFHTTVTSVKSDPALIGSSATTITREQLEALPGGTTRASPTS